jgi:hypothetical protein
VTIIRIPTEDVATASRNVKRYVRAVSKHRTLTTLIAAAAAEMQMAHRALTGGQLAEARRLLGAEHIEGRALDERKAVAR